METNLQVFTNEQFGDVRTFVKDGNVCFIAADCCNALDIQNVRQNLAKFDDDEKGVCTIYTLGGPQKMLYVTEAGLYRLIFMSRKPDAKKFQRWIFHVVIPSLREHGYYALPNVQPTAITPAFLRQIADAMEAKDAKISALEETVGIQQMKIAELQPKASYYDTVLNSNSLVKVSEIAQDYGMSAKKFNKLLHELGVQYKQGRIWLLYKKYAQLGWASTKTYAYSDKDGNEYSSVQLQWTQKGRLGLYDLLKSRGFLPLVEQSSRLAVVDDDDDD